MLKISDHLKQLIQGSPLLNFGFNQRLFNLSKLARYLQTPLEARLQKNVQTSAITMNLSRLQKNVSSRVPDQTLFEVNNISVRNNLATLTYPLTPKIEEIVRKAEAELVKNKYFTITQSTSEITICCDKDLLPALKQKLKHTKPKHENKALSALRVQFPETAAHTSGMIFFLVQTLTLQGINIVEIASTYTEIIFFVETSDIKFAFATIHDSFINV